MDTLSYHAVLFVPIDPYKKIVRSNEASPNDLIAESFRDARKKYTSRRRIYLSRGQADWYCLTEMKGVNPLFDLEFDGWHEWYVIGTVSPTNHPDMKIGKHITPRQRRSAADLESQVITHFNEVSLPEVRQVIPFRR